MKRQPGDLISCTFFPGIDGGNMVQRIDFCFEFDAEIFLTAETSYTEGEPYRYCWVPDRVILLHNLYFKFKNGIPDYVCENSITFDLTAPYALALINTLKNYRWSATDIHPDPRR